MIENEDEDERVSDIYQKVAVLLVDVKGEVSAWHFEILIFNLLTALY